MIPRLGPYLGMAELVRVLLPVLDGDRVGAFETAFGRTLEAGHAIAFPYGRSALWAFFKAVGIEHAEIIQPAYSCSVVAHATVLAGNTPRFVDISLADYNMNLSQVEAAMSPRTRAVVATHLFGYPLDVDRLSDVVAAAERRYGGKIWVVQDCAHAFGAQWRGEPVFRRADVALFGLNVSKMMTSIFGGMLSTTDAALAARVRSWRDQHFRRPRVSKSLRRRVYLLGAMAAFDRRTCGVVDWCERRTSWLDSVTRAYHRDGQIRFPPDYLDEMLPIEATVGLEQLRKSSDIVCRRKAHASAYDRDLAHKPGVERPPLIDGATYSHYVVRVRDRERVTAAMRRRGVLVGRVIDYCVPELAEYRESASGGTFPNAHLSSEQVINLPVHARLSMRGRTHVIEALLDAVADVDAGARRRGPRA